MATDPDRPPEPRGAGGTTGHPMRLAPLHPRSAASPDDAEQLPDESEIDEPDNDDSEPDEEPDGQPDTGLSPA